MIWRVRDAIKKHMPVEKAWELLPPFGLELPLGGDFVKEYHDKVANIRLSLTEERELTDLAEKNWSAKEAFERSNYTSWRGFSNFKKDYEKVMRKQYGGKRAGVGARKKRKIAEEEEEEEEDSKVNDPDFEAEESEHDPEVEDESPTVEVLAEDLTESLDRAENVVRSLAKLDSPIVSELSKTLSLLLNHFQNGEPMIYMTQSLDLLRQVGDDVTGIANDLKEAPKEVLEWAGTVATISAECPFCKNQIMVNVCGKHVCGCGHPFKVKFYATVVME